MKTPNDIAKWVIDNRCSKSENEKLSDFEMYNKLVLSIEKLLTIPDISADLLDHCNRVEVIDNTGRAYVNWKNTLNVKINMQDNNRTLKIFIK